MITINKIGAIHESFILFALFSLHKSDAFQEVYVDL